MSVPDAAPPDGAHLLRVWLVVWPVLTLLSYALFPWIGPWPLPLRTLVTSGLMVPLVVAVILP